jgi:hypothetical protein
VLGRPKRCKLAHALLWKYSYKRLTSAQLLSQLGVVLTFAAAQAAARRWGFSGEGGRLAVIFEFCQ